MAALTRLERRLVALLAILLALALFVVVGPAWSFAGLHFGRSSHRATQALDADPEKASQPADDANASTGAADDATATQPVDSAPAASGPANAPSHQAGWVALENKHPGTDAWKITARSKAGFVEGFARTTSAAPGTSMQLFVSTAAPTFTAEVYRMGFYGGARARLMWTSPSTPGKRQSQPNVDPRSGLIEARWSPTLTVPIGADWPPGAYLVKLVSSAGDQSYAPFTVRDDSAHGDVLFVSAVATWQAYNQWGGCSLYECHGIKGLSRAVKVSFDRPYGRGYNDGSADFLDHELPLIALIEEIGIDARYSTSIDVHETRDIVTKTNAVISPGHDEYYSAPMRQALLDARNRGVNLAFFGANAIYRHIRLERATVGGQPNRVMVNYRNLPDPVRADATLEWRLQGKPEASIVGIQYLCAGLDADMVVASSHHWIWANTNVTDGQVLPRLVGNESDSVDRTVSPTNLDVLSSSPVKCGSKASTAASGYHTTPSGAGVFASGTIWWVCAIDAQYCSVPANSTIVRTATINVLQAFVQGPAARTHPSGQSSR